METTEAEWARSSTTPASPKIEPAESVLTCLGEGRGEGGR